MAGAFVKALLRKGLRHDPESFAKLGEKVVDPRAKAAHILRGQTGYMVEAPSGRLRDEDITRLLKHGDDPDVAEEVADFISPSGLAADLERSKQVLDKPLYVVRQEGAMGKKSTDETHLHSALVITPEDVASYKESYGKSATVYKLDVGTEIYHPAGLADTNEVVVSRKMLNRATKASEADYAKGIEAGKPLFSVGGLVGTGLGEQDESKHSRP